MEYYLQTYHWLDARMPPLENQLKKLASTVEGMLTEAAAKEKTREAESRARQSAEEATQKKELQEAEPAGTRQVEAQSIGPPAVPKKIAKLRWLWSGIALSLAGLGAAWFFALLWGTGLGGAEWPEQETWYMLFLYTLTGIVVALPGVCFIRRGITGYFLNNPANDKISKWWWFLPVALGFIGGVSAWLKNKNVNWRQARNMLTAGILLTLIFTAIPLKAGEPKIPPPETPIVTAPGPTPTQTVVTPPPTTSPPPTVPPETTLPVTTTPPTITPAPPPEITALVTTTPTTTTPATTTPVKVAPYGTIRIATAEFSYESTDPIYYDSFWGWSMYDSLISYDADGNYIPQVAESWSLSPDGNTWTFKIRKDIKFHNGDPLTALDVKFSVDRFASKESTNPWSPYLRNNLNHTEVTDDYTFVYVTNKPEPPLVVPFALTRILPKKYFERVGQDEFRRAPVGSGPWKFVKHVPETSFKMEANINYWGQVPAYQYVWEAQVPEESTRIAMLKRGEVDIIQGLSYDSIKDLVNEGYRTGTIGLPTLSNISFQGTWLQQAGPTGDIRIRQAMSYALNRQEIVDTWFRGFGKPGGQWWMHPGSYGYTDALAADPFDPDKARQLLAQAGYPGKFLDPTIHIYATAATGSTGGQDYVTLLTGYWEKVGLQVKLEVVDLTVFSTYFFSFNRLKGGEPNVGWIVPWTYPSVFNSTYHAANMYLSTGVHNTGNDPKADELYKKATAELDPIKARQYYAEFQIYARSMYVNVGIANVDSLVLVSPDLGEFTGKNWMSLYDASNGIQHKK
ncbi:MAG: hypothetical protein A2Z29_11470 [Chloroflexi bacterium RBG_16_56_11]|nr:MAG: hypothetical protein A2Z29_11470 [Chloroflexi bacterium RBG_16_56_11]